MISNGKNPMETWRNDIINATRTSTAIICTEPNLATFIQHQKNKKHKILSPETKGEFWQKQSQVGKQRKKKN